MQFSTPRLTFRPITIHDAEDVHQIRGREEVMKWSMKQTIDKDVHETREWVEAILSVPNGVFAIIEREPSSSSPSASASASSTETTGRERVIGTIGMRLMDAPPALFEDSYVVTSSAEPFLSPMPSSSSSSSVSPGTGTGAGSSTNSEKSKTDGEEKKKAKPPQRWELGYHFLPDVWGKGYGTEAVKGILGAWAQIRAGLQDQDKSGAHTPGNGEEEGKGAKADMVYAVTNRTNGPSRRVLEKTGFEVVGTYVDHIGTECVDYGVLISSAST